MKIESIFLNRRCQQKQKFNFVFHHIFLYNITNIKKWSEDIFSIKNENEIIFSERERGREE